MKKRTPSTTPQTALALAVVLAAAVPALRASPIALDLTGSYTQNFDTLANTPTNTNLTWTNDGTIAGWYASRGAYRVSTGSDTTGALYSFGSSSSTDRALGGIGSGAGNVEYGAVFLVPAGFTVSDFNVTYTGEQWRNGNTNSAPTGLQSLAFSYTTSTSLPSITASGSGISALNFVSPTTGGPSGAIDGDAAANRQTLTAPIDGAVLTGGIYLLLKWTDVNDLGNDHGFGIDDFTLTWNATGPANGNASLLWTGGNATWGTSVNQFQAATPNDTTWNNASNGTLTTAAFITTNTVGIDAGGIVANALDFRNGSSGTVVNGPGTLTITSGGITVATSSSVTIASAISGTNGLALSGGGTLALTSLTSDFTGGVSLNAGTLLVSNEAQLGNAGNAINLNGGTLKADGNLVVTRTLNVLGSSTLDNGGSQLTINSALSGGGGLTLNGTGTTTLAAPSPAFTGGVTIAAGTLLLTADDGNGMTGVGANTNNPPQGVVSISENAALLIKAGVNPGRLAPGPFFAVNLAAGGTLGMTGTSASHTSTLTGTITIGATTATATTAHLLAQTAGETLILGNTVRGTIGTVLKVEGAGVVQITSGAVSAVSGSQFRGSWEVAMDQATGILAVGPIQTGGFGEVLNGLGYPNSSTSAPGGPKGEGNRVTVTSGTLAFGANAANLRATGAILGVTSFRNPLTLNGGKIASTGFEYSSMPGDPDSTTPVTANLASNISTAAGKLSTVLLYDPRLGASAGGRSLNIMNDAQAYNGTDAANTIASNLSWGDNSTLAVDATGVTAGVGALSFTRNTGTVTVGTNATLQINANAAVNLSGAMDPLASNSTNSTGTYVNVVNNGSLAVLAGAKSAGTVSGTGATTVTGGTSSSFSAAQILQGGLSVDGSVTLRNNNSTSATASKVSALSIAGAANAWTGKVDITNNALIVQATASKATVLSTLGNQAASGKNGGTWNGNGITSSAIVGNANAALAIVDNASLGLASFGGQPVNADSLIVTRAIIGDADLSGNVDLGDFDRWFANVSNSTYNYAAGDFDLSGIVDLGDFDLWFSHVGVNTLNVGAALAGGVSAVPEPASLAVLALGGAALLGRRRRR